MLKCLNISNFAVIDHLAVDFKPGLNILTGETGSGKSIIVDALGLLMGARSSPTQIRTGETHASVEGIFQIETTREQEIRAVLNEIGLEAGSELSVRREIYAAGRGRIFINERSATLGVLKKLQPFLSDIYGQGEQRALLSAHSHRQLLDYFGDCVQLKNEVRQIFLRLKSVERELKELVSETSERERSADFIQHQLAEIESVKPVIGEDEGLLSERRVLANAEKIIELYSSSYQDLYESDDSILARLALIRRRVEELGGFVESAGGALESLLSGIASLTDAAEALRSFGHDLDYSPARLAQVESRLAELEKLKRKYGQSLEGILQLRDELSRKLSSSGDLSERINILKVEADALRHEYVERAELLTSCRRTAAPLLEQRVMSGLGQLAMGQTVFLVSIETSNLEEESTALTPFSNEVTEESAGSDFFTPNGADYVEFLFSANQGESPRPLSYVASGGELSRLMLTLRTINQEDAMVATVVFDEIDVGIGGRVAEAVGHSLKKISTARQVFCVTHQAQIAKFADHHFQVTKRVQRERTSTEIRELTPEERISELSRMIGGNEKAEKTREAARWLLENAKGSVRTRIRKPK